MGGFHPAAQKIDSLPGGGGGFWKPPPNALDEIPAYRSRAPDSSHRRRNGSLDDVDRLSFVSHSVCGANQIAVY